MKVRLLSLLISMYGMTAIAQNKLSGKVTNEWGEELIGVSVYEKGTTNGTTTNVTGNYSLSYKNENAVIVFSYVGFASQEITAGSQTELNITMKPNTDLKAVDVVGSRRPNRTATQTTAPVDIIDVSRLAVTVGQPDVNQLLQYAAPSFNNNKQSGADGADHISPATLRGLGPDQTLVLINGKRRHQSSLINIFGTRGRGNTGTDLSALPSSSIDRIEILRDGASAQYGSDAIAGVVNLVLKSNVNEFTGNITTGMYNAKPPSKFAIKKSDKDYDGQTTQLNANYGATVGKNGFINVTTDYLKQSRTNRPTDPEKFDIYRNQFGDAASENFGTYFNSSFSAGENAEVYLFGGYNYRFTDAYAWTRDAESERNVTDIYPNGFDPKIQSVITDKSMSAGVKSKVGGWNLDVNNTIGANRFHFYVNNTLNAALENKSPTRFDAGGFSLLENTTSINLSHLYKNILEGLNIAVGAEHRIENYKIFAGEEGSYSNYGGVIFSIDTAFDDTGAVVSVDTTLRPGGSQGFPGFRPANELNESRTNIGMYIDAELDITKALTIGAAGRFERYSDFGNTSNGKFAARVNIIKGLSLRASASTGFRAPSLAQLYYNTTFTDFVAGVPIDKIIAKNNSPITRTLGIPDLKQEKSVNISGGITARIKAFELTIDGYYVQIKDRIVLTGAFYDDDPDIGADLQQLNVGAAQFFTNAVNTTTTGVDAILGYSVIIANKQSLRISLAVNFNDMTIDDIYTNKKLAGKENTYFGIREQYFLLASAPKSKMSLAFDYSISKFFAMIRFTQFGKVELINFWDNGNDIAETNLVDDDGNPYSEVDTYDPKMTTDLTIGYRLSNVQISIGASNLFNVYPDEHDAGWTESGGNWDAVQMGFSGAYYFARLGFKF